VILIIEGFLNYLAVTSRLRPGGGRENGRPCRENVGILFAAETIKAHPDVKFLGGVDYMFFTDEQCSRSVIITAITGTEEKK